MATATTLREILEEIWQRPGVLHPHHSVWWNTDYGYRVTGELADPVYHAKGKRAEKQPRRKPDDH